MPVCWRQGDDSHPQNGASRPHRNATIKAGWRNRATNLKALVPAVTTMAHSKPDYEQVESDRHGGCFPRLACGDDLDAVGKVGKREIAKHDKDGGGLVQG